MLKSDAWNLSCLQTTQLFTRQFKLHPRAALYQINWWSITFLKVFTKKNYEVSSFQFSPTSPHLTTLTKLTWDFLLGKVILTMSMTSVNVRATCKRKCLFCKSKVCGFCLVVLLFKVCYMVHLLNVCYMVHLLKHVSRVLTLRPPPVIRRWVISQLLFHFSWANTLHALYTCPFVMELCLGLVS